MVIRRRRHDVDGIQGAGGLQSEPREAPEEAVGAAAEAAARAAVAAAITAADLEPAAGAPSRGASVSIQRERYMDDETSRRTALRPRPALCRTVGPQSAAAAPLPWVWCQKSHTFA